MVYIVLHQGHFIAVLQDTSNASVHLLGSAIPNPTQDSLRTYWTAFHGERIYQHICRLHDWDAGDAGDVTLYQCSPQQNGYDCGIISIQLAVSFFEHGVHYESDGRLSLPVLQCGHHIRLHIFQELRQQLLNTWEEYQRIYHDPPLEWTTWSSNNDALEAEYGDLEFIRPDIQRLSNATLTETERRLQNEIDKCPVCLRELNTPRDSPPPSPVSPRVAPAPASERGSETANHNKDDAGPHGHVQTLRPKRRHPRVASRIPLEESVMHTLHGRRPEPMKMVPLPEQMPLWPRQYKLFDKYFDGHTREDMRLYEDPIYTFKDNPYAVLTIKSLHTKWRDYGYRLSSRFAHQFYLPPPVQICRHESLVEGCVRADNRYSARDSFSMCWTPIRLRLRCKISTATGPVPP